MALGVPGEGPNESILSFDEITGRLDKVYEGASVNMWLEALTDIQNEIGPDDFESQRLDLYAWGVKTGKYSSFFDALNRFNPGSSLTMNVGNNQKEQLAFAYAQGQSDRIYLEREAAILHQEINDHDLEGGFYDERIDEAYENLDTVTKKQKALNRLMDEWEAIMLEAGMDPDDYPWFGLRKSQKLV